RSSCFLSCWIRELILSLSSSSPSPSVIFPLRSRIVIPPTTRSSICMAVLLLGRSGSSAAPAALPVRRKKDLPAYYDHSNSVKRISDLGVRFVCPMRRPGELFADRFDDDVQDRNEDDVQESGHHHPAGDRRADGMPGFLSGTGGKNERKYS